MKAYSRYSWADMSVNTTVAVIISAQSVMSP